MADPFSKIMKGKTKIPYLNKTYPNYMLAGGIAVLAVAGYMYYTGGLGGGGFDKDFDAPLVASADDVEYEIVPDEVRPNSYVTATGMFKDASGQAVAVPEAFYYVFEDIGANGRELRARGSLGKNVSRFSQNIPTPNFRQGVYTIIIADIANQLSEQEIGPLNIGTGVGGSGAIQGTPTASLNTPGGARPVSLS